MAVKTSKALRVKYSPIFEDQLKKLREAIKEKDSKFHKQLLKAIEREKDNLLVDMHKGIQIPKSQIPKEYVDKYGVTNLWKNLFIRRSGQISLRRNLYGRRPSPGALFHPIP